MRVTDTNEAKRTGLSGAAGVWAAVLSMLVVAACSTASAPGTAETAAPTGSGVEVDRLESMLYAFADDSMMGREAGTEGHRRAARYLEERARAYGLEPAGEDGTYLQEVPLVQRAMTSSLEGPFGVVDVSPDFAPIVLEDFGSPESLDFTDIPVVYGGDMASPTEISAADAAGKVVVLGAARGPNGRAFGLVGQSIQKLAGAEAILMASTDYATSDILGFLLEPQLVLDEGEDDGSGADGDGPFLAFVSEAFVEQVFGAGVDELQTGTEGPTFTGRVGPDEEPLDVPTYNVVARVEGSDPELRDEHVVLSAHSDHTGLTTPPVDHDSLRAYLEVVRPGGAEDPEREPTAEEAERIRRILEDQEGERRLDSIDNGADDDGSGSVALLEIGRVLAESSERPRRSVLLVWHTAEEGGLLGARHYTDNPTVPLEDMIATVNVDMIGRGTAEDREMGGPGYLQLIGSRRISSELGDLVEAVNEEEGHGMAFDYTYDADGHPANYYCRSDHYMYARYGVPVVFMTTGGHRDYHMRTDEPQYVDYEKLGGVTEFIRGVVTRAANRDERFVIDGRIPDPDEPCQQ
ncbi:MAG: M28 family peptidase [Gemmatimonadota bacterium]|nr:M28 family peptidase [Gemmatimonadota bacterium]